MDLIVRAVGIPSKHSLMKTDPLRSKKVTEYRFGKTGLPQLFYSLLSMLIGKKKQNRQQRDEHCP